MNEQDDPSPLRLKITSTTNVYIDFAEELARLRNCGLKRKELRRQIAIIKEASEGKLQRARRLYEELPGKEKEFIGLWFDQLFDLVDRHSIHGSRVENGVTILDRSVVTHALSDE